MRIGFGYDSHRLEEGRPCILGGVRIPGVPGPSGFSDGDAVAHAVIDALLGAAALGDIGGHFPPGDHRWRDANSMDLLRRVVAHVRDAGHRVGNVDVTVVCELPKIAPAADAIRRSLGEGLDLDPASVSVKGKSNEGMGWEGRREGLAVYAVALLLTPQ